MKNFKQSFETLKISTPVEHILQVEIHRPQKLNAMNQKFWEEIFECFSQIGESRDIRVVLLTGSGRMFTAGLDVTDMVQLGSTTDDVARRAMELRKTVLRYQRAFSILEAIPQPVVAAVHNACIGGGVDLVAACDIRVCTEDAFFQIKEIDLGIVADVGTLQRLPKIIGSQSLVRELAYTGRKLDAKEAKACGLVSAVFKDKQSLEENGLRICREIAAKSPVAISGTKSVLNYARDHSVKDSLEYFATWNISALQTEDIPKAVSSFFSKTTPLFSRL